MTIAEQQPDMVDAGRTADRSREDGAIAREADRLSPERRREIGREVIEEYQETFDRLAAYDRGELDNDRSPTPTDRG